MSVSPEPREQSSAPPESATREARHDVADTLSVASEAVKPAKTGMGRKIALAGMIWRLAKRFPGPALVVGGIALVIYLNRRRTGASMPRSMVP